MQDPVALFELAKHYHELARFASCQGDAEAYQYISDIYTAQAEHFGRTGHLIDLPIPTEPPAIRA